VEQCHLAVKYFTFLVNTNVDDALPIENQTNIKSVKPLIIMISYNYFIRNLVPIYCRLTVCGNY